MPYLCRVLRGLGYRDIMHVLTWDECIIYELELDQLWIEGIVAKLYWSMKNEAGLAITDLIVLCVDGEFG